MAAIVLASASLGGAAFVVVRAEERSDLSPRTLPVDSLGESTLLMVGPLLLAILAMVCGLLSCRHLIGKIGLGFAVLSLAILLAVLGESGLKHLF
jgi:hypothetical protein